MRKEKQKDNVLNQKREYLMHHANQTDFIKSPPRQSTEGVY